MKAVVEVEGVPLPCLVRWVGRQSLLKVTIHTYCGHVIDAAQGTVQVPDELQVCSSCELGLAAEMEKRA